MEGGINETVGRRREELSAHLFYVGSLQMSWLHPRVVLAIYCTKQLGHAHRVAGCRRGWADPRPSGPESATAADQSSNPIRKWCARLSPDACVVSRSSLRCLCARRSVR